jgi:hypothetical protein
MSLFPRANQQVSFGFAQGRLFIPPSLAAPAAVGMTTLF